MDSANSVMGTVLYNILTQFGIPMKLHRLIKCVYMTPEVKSAQVKIC